MLDLQALIDHVNQCAADTGHPLPAAWSAHWAASAQPLDPEALPGQIPLVLFFQGRELWSAREGSPCHQSALPSVLVAVVVCDKRQLAQRLTELRRTLYGWQAPGDREHLPLYLSDDPAMPCDTWEIKGDYHWWMDYWMTRYSLTGY